eukprot:6198886-Pleurochrysis_carterae.AAC.5
MRVRRCIMIRESAFTPTDRDELQREKATAAWNVSATLSAFRSKSSRAYNVCAVYMTANTTVIARKLRNERSTLGRIV